MHQPDQPLGLPRIETGVEGFEHISIGGLVKGRTTLVVGTSGSGKTLFSLELLYRSVIQYNRPGIFVTFEELPEDIVANVARMGWELNKLIAEKRVVILDASPQEELIGEIGPYDLSGIIAQIKDAISEIGAQFVVLDSLGGLFEQFGNPTAIRREVFRIVRTLRKNKVTSVVTAERLEEYGPLSRLGIEEFVSDCVVVLRQILVEERVRRTIQVHKLRGDIHRPNEFPFTISDHGIVINPLSGAELDQASSLERISFGTLELDEMAGGGLFRDSVILVSGPTGGGKTLMCSTFAAEGCRNGERVLFLGFEESTPQLIRNATSWGVDFQGWVAQGLLRLSCRYPESFGLETHLYAIRKEIEVFQPDRLVIDSVSALERIGHTRNFREFVISLTSYVKKQQICSLFTCTSPRISGGDSITETHISTITDAIILLRYVEVKASLRRAIVIIKMRGSQHDKNVREFTIDDRGLHIKEPFENVPNILLGLPSSFTEENASNV
ncbi:MAG: circadian clock protein KaiC [Gemmataceae bacterium]